jgi:hypothetical protein
VDDEVGSFEGGRVTLCLFSLLHQKFVDLRGFYLRVLVELRITHHRVIKGYGIFNAVNFNVRHDLQSIPHLICSPLLITLATHIEILQSL